MCDCKCDENFKKEVENNKIVHWNYRNLEYFPELLKNNKHIIDLYLKGNCISTVPKWIPEMENLSEIHLSSNKLTNLPEEISKLKILRVLDVLENQITELPQSLTSLKQLVRLDASKNLLKKLPDDIGKMKALQHLYLSENQISRIPNSIDDCISLREINLNSNNLTSIPKSMVRMFNLRIMSVNQNKLLYLPPIPFKTEHLTILAEKNEYLSHISHEVEIWSDNWLRLRMDDPVDENERKNFGGLRNVAIPEYSVICTEKGSTLVIPMTVHHLNDKKIMSLQEYCFRELEFLLMGKRTSTLRQLLSGAPYLIRKLIGNGPKARCYRCERGLYQYAFIKILCHRTRPKLNIIEYFCCKVCYVFSRVRPDWREIKWKHSES